jgi:hypothetical protein
MEPKNQDQTEAEGTFGTISPLDLQLWREHHGYFNNSTIRLWQDVFETNIKYQTHYCFALLLRGVSCMAMKNLKFIVNGNEKLDPRIALNYFSDASSGKGMGKDFYAEIFGKPTPVKNYGVGLNITNLSKPTIEKLAGSINDQIQAENRKKQRSPGSANYVDPIIHGYLETADDIILDEAELFYDGKEYGTNILRLCRMALDNYGSANNYIRAGETLKNVSESGYYCKSNVMFLSYHLDDISDTIIKNGIFQRVVTFFYHLDQQKIKEISTLNVRSTNANYIEKRNKLIQQLKEIGQYIEQMQGDITITEHARDQLNEQLEGIMKALFADGDVSKYLQSFIPRLKNLFLKVAGCLALIKKKQQITELEIDEAILLVNGVAFESLKRELIQFGKLPQDTKKQYFQLKKALGTTSYSKEEILARMQVVWGQSRNPTHAKLRKFFDNKLLVHSGEKVPKGAQPKWKML